MMETDRFDALTTRLAQGLTRRRSLGLLAALGAATSLAADAGARKHHKKKHGKKHKPKTTPPPCGGACGECEACFNDACTQVANGTTCGSGQCFAGDCLTCSGGKVPAEGLCARPCTTIDDCADGGICLKMSNDNDGGPGDNRRFCVITDGAQGGATMPNCPTGRSSGCRAGMLCVDFFTSKCAVPA
jgi:hypothetical protein